MFAATVRSYRRRLGLTQEELAAKVDLNVRSIRKLESGRIASPRAATIRLLADAFGLTGVDRERFHQAATGEPTDPPARTEARVRSRSADGTYRRPGQTPGFARCGRSGRPDGHRRAGRQLSQQTANRRLLIMLDNTASAEQVRPLLPGNGSCAVVVTSRDSLAGLVAVHGAHRIDLELLPRAEAVTLLRRLIGPRAIYPGPNVAAFVSGPWDMPTAILSTGCVLDPDTSAGEADENGRHFLSAEQLNLLDAPMVVLLQSDAVEGERAAADEIAADSLWEGLPAVQAGLVFEFDRLGYPGIEGQIRFLQEIAALGG